MSNDLFKLKNITEMSYAQNNNINNLTLSIILNQNLVFYTCNKFLRVLTDH